MTSAGQRTATLATRGPRYLNGKLNTWGHSYNTLGASPARMWNARLSYALGGSPIYQRGVGGSSLVIGELTAGKPTGGYATIAQNMQRTTVASLVSPSIAPQPGIHSIITGLNDLGNIALMTGSPSTGNQKTALDCYADTQRAVIAYLCSTALLEAETAFSPTAINVTFTNAAGTAGTNGGSWTVQNGTVWNSGSGYRTTAATGDKMIYAPTSIASTADFGNTRTVDIFFLCPGASQAVNGSVITFTDENSNPIYPQGYPQGTPFDTSVVRPAYANVAWSTPYWKVARFKVAAGTTRQIVASAGVGGMTVDTLGLEGDFPPPILWFNVAKTPGASAGVLALVDPINTRTAAVVAEFASPYIVHLDTNTALKLGDPGNVYGMWNIATDTTHPGEPGQRIMSALAYNALAAMPLNAQQSVTLGGGLDNPMLEAVDVVATTNLSLTGNATIDGVAVQTGQRVLCNGQTTQSQNGVWVVDTGFSWVRPLDFVTGQNGQGKTVVVRGTGGTSIAGGSVYSLVSSTNVVIDTTAHTWTRLVAPGGVGLTRTAVKTGAYNAAAGDLVPVDTTSGSVTVTLPAAPPDLTLIAVKHVTRGGTNTVTVNCAGSDHFATTTGATSRTLTVTGESVMALYQASTAVWTVVATDVPLSQLDLRYSPTAVGLLPTAYIHQSHPRYVPRSTSALYRTGAPYAQLVYFPQALTITNIAQLCAGGTSFTGLTSLWFELWDTTRLIVAKTTDDGATGWTNGTTKTLALTSPYTVAAGTSLYVACVPVMTAGANGTTLVVTSSNFNDGAFPPIVAGFSSDTGATYAAATIGTTTRGAITSNPVQTVSYFS